MLKIDNLDVFNFEGAFRGLRNPMNSWDKSDSSFDTKCDIEEADKDICSVCCRMTGYDKPCAPQIGENDINLAQRMIKAGDSDAKFLRQILVSVDIDAPLFWWKEMSQYKVATVTNSCSTMHKLASTPITKECFSLDNGFLDTRYSIYMDKYIKVLEEMRQEYNRTKDKELWRSLIQMLPESWNQTRTWTGNYAVLRNIYFQRKNHRLSEWHQFCECIEKLPYSQYLLTYNEKS